MMKYFYATLIFIFTISISQAQIQGYNLNDVVDDFTVTDIHGDTHNLYTYTAAGKYVFIDFSFTTCGPCQAVAPIFNEFYDKYGCNDGEVVCIAMFGTNGDNDADVIAFENTYGGTYNHAPAVSNDGGAIAVDSNFNPALYPTICLINPANEIIEMDIYPIYGVETFEDTFPSGFNPSPMSCSQESFTLATNDGTPITDGSVFTFSQLGEEAELTFDITNTGTTTLDMRLEYVSNNNTSTEEGEVLCVFQQCALPGVPAPGHVFPINPQTGGPQEVEPGETTGPGEYFYNTDPGDGVNYPLEYTFRFFDIDGLANSISFTYQYDGTASVEDIAQVSYKLYPTLASDFVTLEVTESVTAELINIQGQIIKQFQFKSGSHSIDVSSLSKQLYYVTLTNNKGQQSLAKILVK